MKTIVLTYHFLGGQIGYILLTQDVFEELKSDHHEYGEILMDPEVNPFGARPTLIEVDLYESAELVEVESTIGSIEYLLGHKITTVAGTLLEHLEKI